MLFNFNIVDESIDDVPVTKEQVAAEIDYDINEKVDIRSLNYINVQITDG